MKHNLSLEEMYNRFMEERRNNPIKLTNREEGINEMKKLYEIMVDGKKLYGHKLATNSQGHWVMEVKGMFAVDKSYVEEVLPHTIGVQYESGQMSYHYLADAGRYQVGEFYILDAPSGRVIVQVTEVDTKSVDATKQFTPLAKLVTA